MITTQAVIERIITIKEDLFGSQHGSDKRFAEAIGVTASLVANIKNKGNQSFGQKLLLNLINYSSNIKKPINTNWLFYGSGSMYLDSEDIHLIAEQKKLIEDLQGTLDSERKESQKKSEIIIQKDQTILNQSELLLKNETFIQKILEQAK